MISGSYPMSKYYIDYVLHNLQTVTLNIISVHLSGVGNISHIFCTYDRLYVLGIHNVLTTRLSFKYDIITD